MKDSFIKISKIKYKKRIMILVGVIAWFILFQIPVSIKTFSKFNSSTSNVIKNHTILKIQYLEEYIRKKNSFLPVGEEKRLIQSIIRESHNLDLPKGAEIQGKKVDPVIFLMALIEMESSFDKNAISIANARGYMQVMPMTAQWIKQRENLSVSVNEIHSTEVNIMLGVKYFNYLSTQFQDLKSICLAYNVGEANFRKGFYDIYYWNKIEKFYKEIYEFIETKNQETEKKNSKKITFFKE
ncbi:MAG: lytic transglycosylase domain-containing protein [Leptonema sp. (in: bacteria)]